MQIFKRFYATVRPPIAFKYKIKKQDDWVKNTQRIIGSETSQRTRINDKGPFSTRMTTNFKIKHADKLDSQKTNFIDIDESQQKTSQNENFVSLDLLRVCEPKPKRVKVKNITHKNITHKNNEIVYGIYPVLLALQNRRRDFFNLYYKEASLHNNSKVKEIFDLCQSYDIPTHCVNKDKFLQLVGPEPVHQGVCLEASKLPFLIYEKLTEEDKLNFKRNNDEKLKLWLYLDQIQDPMNLGAILRTAYYLGADKLFTSQTDSCPISNVVSKASSGVAEIVPVYRILEIDNFVRILQEKNWHIISSIAQSNKAISVEEFHSSKNIFLAVGNEGKGVSNYMEENSDILLTIPPSETCVEHIQSLNVSVATSILLHSLLAKLKQGR